MKRNSLFLKWGMAFCALGVFFMASCYEDKGNYNYSEIPKVTFNDLDAVYMVDLGGKITIKPTLDPAFEDESGFTYKWIRINMVYDANGYKSIETVSTDKWLEDAEIPQLKMGENRMMYEVTDKRGFKYTSDYFVIEVDNPYKTGFVVLVNEKENGKDEAALRFLNYDPIITGKRAEQITITNLQIEGLPQLGKARSIAAYYDDASPALDGKAIDATGEKIDAKYAITMVTETGLYKLSPFDFTYNNLYDSRHYLTGNFSNTVITDIINPGQGGSRAAQVSMYLRDDKNNIYFYRFGAGAVTYSPWAAGVYLNRYKNADGTFTNFEAAKPFIGLAAANPTSVIYDKTNKQFAFKIAADNFCTPMTSSADLLFPMANCGANFDLIWMVARSHGYANSPAFFNIGMATIAYAVAKNTNDVPGALDLLMFEAASYSDVTNGAAYGGTASQAMIDIKNFSSISDAKFFAIHDHRNNNTGNSLATVEAYRPVFMYATNKTVFGYNLTGETGPATDVYTLQDASETIVNMSFIPYPPLNTNPFAHNLLLVTTKPNGLRSDGTSGPVTIIRIFEVATPRGTLTMRKLKDMDGNLTDNECEWTIDGEYADIDWKARTL